MVIETSGSPFPLRYRFDDTLSARTRECLLALLRDNRDAGICPSEAARELAGQLGTEWRDLMRPVRLVAAELAREGRLEIRQDGKRVDILDARGPLRLHYRGW
ncbi:MAG: DUF3253 domain-containing protein [Xanthomonadaceae bacterium]|nr:DUF3253 domain-containing protein [Xanthomonadaceae bacterium]